MGASRGSITESLGPGLSEGLRDYFACRESHIPMPCERRSDDGDCLLGPMRAKWTDATRPYPHPEHPLVFALSEAGCERHRAQAAIDEEGQGMDATPSIVAAFERLRSDQQATVRTRVAEWVTQNTSCTREGRCSGCSQPRLHTRKARLGAKTCDLRNRKGTLWTMAPSVSRGEQRQHRFQTRPTSRAYIDAKLPTSAR